MRRRAEDRRRCLDLSRLRGADPVRARALRRRPARARRGRSRSIRNPVTRIYHMGLVLERLGSRRGRAARLRQGQRARSRALPGADPGGRGVLPPRGRRGDRQPAALDPRVRRGRAGAGRGLPVGGADRRRRASRRRSSASTSGRRSTEAEGAAQPPGPHARDPVQEQPREDLLAAATTWSSRSRSPCATRSATTSASPKKTSSASASPEGRPRRASLAVARARASRAPASRRRLARSGTLRAMSGLVERLRGIVGADACLVAPRRAASSTSATA